MVYKFICKRCNHKFTCEKDNFITFKLFKDGLTHKGTKCPNCTRNRSVALAVEYADNPTLQSATE